MNSKIYRCGWCGCPTDHNGKTLPPKLFQRVIEIVENYGDDHTKQVHGDCCRAEMEGDRWVTITRDMAIDAGDLSLEGQRIEW